MDAMFPILFDTPIPDVISGAKTTLAVYNFGLLRATIIPKSIKELMNSIKLFL